MTMPGLVGPTCPVALGSRGNFPGGELQAKGTGTPPPSAPEACQLEQRTSGERGSLEPTSPMGEPLCTRGPPGTEVLVQPEAKSQL